MSNDNGKPQTADLEYVRTYVASLKKPVYAQCRGKGHAYPDRPRISLVEPGDNSVIECTWKCRRCHVKRIETVHVDNASRTAHTAAVRYEDHPEGYLMERGHGRLDGEGRAIIRYENLHSELLRQAGGR